MRFTLTLLGREVLAVSIARAGQPEQGPDEHDHTCAQVELAAEVPLGFHIPPIPSLDPTIPCEYG